MNESQAKTFMALIMNDEFSVALMKALRYLKENKPKDFTQKQLLMLDVLRDTLVYS